MFMVLSTLIKNFLIKINRDMNRFFHVDYTIVPQLLHIWLFLPHLGVVSLYKLGCILHGVGIKSMASGYVCVLC